MAAVDLRVREARDDGELAAVVFDDVEIRGEFVVGAVLLGEEVLGVETEIGVDAEHAARGFGRFFGGADAAVHDVERGKGQGDAGSAEHAAAGDAMGLHGYLFRNSSLWTTSWMSVRKP